MSPLTLAVSGRSKSIKGELDGAEDVECPGRAGRAGQGRRRVHECVRQWKGMEGHRGAVAVPRRKSASGCGFSVLSWNTSADGVNVVFFYLWGIGGWRVDAEAGVLQRRPVPDEDSGRQVVGRAVLHSIGACSDNGI